MQVYTPASSTVKLLNVRVIEGFLTNTSLSTAESFLFHENVALGTPGLIMLHSNVTCDPTTAV